MKILVFGKDGQLGKAFREVLDQTGASRLHHIEYLGRSQCDLLDGAAITHHLDHFKPDLVINASAYTAVDKAETDRDVAFDINAKAPEIMASYAVKHGATFLHYSTDYVFDGSKAGFYVESDSRNPLGVYGASKAKGEKAIEDVFSNSDQGQYAIFRTSWVYGDGNNFIRTILRLAKERDELKVIHDQHGVPTSAAWLARVSLDLVLDEKLNLRKFSSGIYHAVPAGETTWYDLAKLVTQAAIHAGIALKVGPEAIKPIPAVDYPLPAPRPANSRMDRAKLRLAIEQTGDMSKLQHCNSLWDQEVQGYVTQLAKDGLI
ncbi:dTDP-4-dehydrorhamnose reductase [Polynucleobacter sp. MWH-Berg-3C6]|uniref:dTDP-4-dehydrorhamnose reductase n=1 Tax=Polynucleobacter sp. MWH-Berg-3C6 TaxID=1855882 RepID=UPI001C0D43D0|nr:dTDP-4-dehydrorhamnose reductase [Polynucleobacter sp. MWH-Berg-3C6]MBU3549845.1 dTDP-4-dehydrorhamnose reductase [Polynucleobacter sp. MWH-Berg-3C6]